MPLSRTTQVLVDSCRTLTLVARSPCPRRSLSTTALLRTTLLRYIDEAQTTPPEAGSP